MKMTMIKKTKGLTRKKGPQGKDDGDDDGLLEGRKGAHCRQLTFSGCDSHRLQHCRPLLGLCQIYHSPHCTVWSNECLYNNSVQCISAQAKCTACFCGVIPCSLPNVPNVFLQHSWSTRPLLVLRHMQILLLQASWTVSFYTVESTGPPLPLFCVSVCSSVFSTQ